MAVPIIDVRNLSRRFETRGEAAAPANRGWWPLPFFRRKILCEMTAVDRLNFSIEPGQKVAFIGPNGAGKSTTLKMLCGLLTPTDGTASVCGLTPWEDTRALSRHIGLVFGQRTHLWPNLPVRDSFELLARIYDLNPAQAKEQTDRLVDMFGLTELLGQEARTLSLGQRMRCDIAAALLHRPSVLFLDEPTIGLDVTAKALLRDHLNKLAQQFETTVLLTSHDTDDIEKICHRVILIDHGMKLLDTTLPELQREYTHTKILRLSTEEKEPTFTHPHVEIEAQSDHTLALKVDVRHVPIETIVAQCLSRFKLHDIGIEGMPLEDIIKTLYAQREGKV